MTQMQSTKQHILVVEDETDICELLQYVLEREGFQVTCVNNGMEALELAGNKAFTLAVLDIMLPGMDGLTLCRKLRENQATRRMPIVMLTARSEESDVVVGLEVGADDYLTKPFSPKELVARIRAVLRRVNDRDADGPAATLTKPVQAQDPGMVTLGQVAIDPTRHTVKVRDVAVQLTLAEFKLLALLMSRPGRVFSRDQILEQISGSDVYVIDRNVDVHIRAIRKKFGDDAEFIQTVRGVGYKCLEA
jgi:two-component system alkaline phosphatase synthesis response regulator PhoP